MTTPLTETYYGAFNVIPSGVSQLGITATGISIGSPTFTTNVTLQAGFGVTGAVPGNMLLGPTGMIMQGGTEYRGPTFSHTYSNVYETQTVTTGIANLALVPLRNNSATRLDVEVQAYCASGAADWKMSMAWQNVGGTVSGMRSAVLLADSDGTNAGGAPTGWGATMSSTGANAIIQVNGATGTTIDWSALAQWRVTT
jgi:hypothetical protein